MLSSETSDVTFGKTPAGWAEVAQRAAGLSSRQRSILIILDCQKRLREVATSLSPQELSEIADLLLKLKLIEPKIDAAASEAASLTPAVRPTVPSVSAPAPASAKLLQMKSMMSRSAETYLGLMATDIVRRVEQASDETQLLSVVGHWHMAMRDAKHGKDVAGPLLEQIKATFALSAQSQIEQ
jgi:hypothetical protein